MTGSHGPDRPPASDIDWARLGHKYTPLIVFIAVGTIAGIIMLSVRQDIPVQSEIGSIATSVGQTADDQLADTRNQLGQPRLPVANPPPSPQSLQEFSAIVAGLRGTVVSVGRSSQGPALDRNNPTRDAKHAGPAPGVGSIAEITAPDGTLQFAAPVFGSVVQCIGTGFIVSNDGYILTNYHVVRGNDTMMVTVFDETSSHSYPATVVKLDGSLDLALLKISPIEPLSVASLGNSDQTRIADEVIAIGSPFGLDLSVSRGIISAIRNSMVIEGTLHKDLFQIDAAINQGNSGGPLVDRYGDVIGVNTAIYTPNGAFSGVGFAVPINIAKQFMFDQITIPQAPNASFRKIHAFTGSAGISRAAGVAGPPILAGAVSPHRDGRETMDCSICHELLSPPGAQSGAAGQVPPPVSNKAHGIPAALGGGAKSGPPIVAGTPAPHRNGYEKMDCAICHQMLAGPGYQTGVQSLPVAITPPPNGALAAPPIVAGTVPPHRDGREQMDCATCHKVVATGQTALAAPVAQTGIGGGLQFARPPTALNAAVNPQDLTLTLQSTPEGSQMLGASILPITPALSAQTGQPEGKGIFVASVKPGSPSETAGLEAGMIIEKIDGRRVDQAKDLLDAILAAKPGDHLRLSVNNTKGQQEVRLVIPEPTTVAFAPPTPAAAKVPTEFNWRGMEIEAFTSINLVGPAGSVQLKGGVIAETVPGSPAQRAGIKANDVLLEVEGMPTRSAQAMRTAIEAVASKREVTLKISRSAHIFDARVQ